MNHRCDRSKATMPQEFCGRLRPWVAGVALLGMCLFPSLGWTEESQSLQHDAVIGQTMDVASTAVGILAGAAEANPLGILTLGVKAAMYQTIKAAPPDEQPALWSKYGAVGWGATANNLCVLATIASGGTAAALCPLIGVAVGVSAYQGDEERRNTAMMSAWCEKRRKINPDLVCEFPIDG